MGIESGPRGGEVDRPRTLESRIEGEFESTFTELDVDQAVHVPLPTQIVWQTAQLSFREVGRYGMPQRFGGTSVAQLYTGELDYQDPKGKKRSSNLSFTTTKAKPVLFTGTANGFYAHDPLMSGRDNPFYVVGLQPDELIEHFSRLSGAWHELGHVRLFFTDADINLLSAAISLRTKDLPNVADATEYANELARYIPRGIREQQPPFEVTRHALTRLESQNHGIDKIMHLFHERNAWAEGMQLVRRNGYPTGFQDPKSYYEYADLCLSSYALYYRDLRFTKGMGYKS